MHADERIVALPPDPTTASIKSRATRGRPASSPGMRSAKEAALWSVRCVARDGGGWESGIAGVYLCRCQSSDKSDVLWATSSSATSCAASAAKKEGMADDQGDPHRLPQSVPTSRRDAELNWPVACSQGPVRTAADRSGTCRKPSLRLPKLLRRGRPACPNWAGRPSRRAGRRWQCRHE